MRAFIAIELPGPVRAALVSLQRQLAQAEADVKWVEEDNLHVTMRFLGEISEDQRQAIERLLGEVAGRTPRLQLSLSHLGAFPSASSPRVIWVGVGQGSEALSRIAREIEEGLSALHLPREPREFAAHLTLGRVRSPRNRAQLSHRLKELVWKPPAPFEVAHLTLFQSTLTSSGPLYTPLAKPAFSQVV
jgi:2'-5' RNA ligase